MYSQYHQYMLDRDISDDKKTITDTIYGPFFKKQKITTITEKEIIVTTKTVIYKNQGSEDEINNLIKKL